MTTIVVKFANAPKEGSKWASVKDMTDRYYSYDSRQMTLYKGKTYDVEFTTSPGRDGKTFYNITAAKEKAASNGGDSGGDRWYMPFVSNTVAHAIAAGRIDDPEQIKLWAAAAKQAAVELDRKAPPEDLPPEYGE
jgi:hypothetical protein